MPCNWSTMASFLLRSTQARGTVHGRARSGFTSLQVTSTGIGFTTRVGLPPFLRAFRGLATAAAAAPRQDASLSTISPATASSIRSASSSLSTAQVALAAAQAVRLCIKGGNYGDALYVVNSACQSVLQGPLSNPRKDPMKLEPIDFGCPVPPRLAAHAFLHGLIRGGYAKKAKVYANLMILAGIPIRTRTLESVISSLTTRPSPLPKFGPFARISPTPAISKHTVFQLQGATIRDARTRAAFYVLMQARTFGQKRTERMYRVLIETLLMQGEILVASLLFVLLLKDFEAQMQKTKSSEDPGGEDYLSHAHLNVAYPSQAALNRTPYPNPVLSTKILQRIEAHPDTAANPQCLQSLAIFAMLLDTGQIDNHRVAGLISALYRYPRTSARVWILRDGRLVRVHAYEYFHSVLQRLIDSMAGKYPSRPVPNLSTRTYNSLLSYALRHRLSPQMASVVLQHMCDVRKRAPDIVTLNILLRSGTLLRKLSISKHALAMLRQSACRAGDTKIFGVNTSVAKDASSEAGAPRQTGVSSEGESNEEVDVAPKLAGALHRLRREELVLPNRMHLKGIKPTKHTISSFITHLTSTGRPDLVTEMLFEVLPELAVVHHPATVSSTTTHMRFRKRSQALRRAAAHGPYVYASLINALVKARQIGLAERVFILGQYAERASGDPDLAGSVQPWRLSVHAYTALMQGYAAVWRRRVPLGDKDARTALLQQCDPEWRPKARQQYHGYVQLVNMLEEQDRLFEQRRRRQLTRPQLARRNAAMLYRSMLSGGRALFEAIARNAYLGDDIPTARRGARLPPPLMPDARFFNAALRLFLPPHLAAEPPVGKRCTPRYWRRAIARAADLRKRMRIGVGGNVPPTLYKIAAAMVEFGFKVPPAYQPLLLSKWEPAVLRPRRRRRTDAARRPHEYPWRPRTRFNPYQLPVAKTRGLPIRRKTMKHLLGRGQGVRRVQGASTTETVS
ncbi:hypothetical protein BD413DRAFT_692055 [Trametes elegans]|nr:hypothetical protein BD413DRAFT_692055 [Trametes elegans]